MANDYCDIEEVKDAMPDTQYGATYDVALALAVTDASRAIDLFCKREAGAFYVTDDTIRYFDGNATTDLWIDELAAAPTSVQVAETGVLTTLTTWATTDYLLWPYNALAEGKPYKRLIVDRHNGVKTYWPAHRKAVKITGKFGYATIVPAEIRRATIIQSVRYFKRGQQGYQDTGAVQELGQLRYTQQLDPDVRAIVERIFRQKVSI